MSFQQNAFQHNAFQVGTVSAAAPAPFTPTLGSIAQVATPRLQGGYTTFPNLLLTTLALFAANSQLIKRDATLQNTKPAPAVQAFQQHNLLTSTLRKFPFGSDDGVVDNLVRVIQVPMASPQGTNFLLLSAANPIPIGGQSTASAPSDPTRNGYGTPTQNRVLLDVAAVATAPVGTQSTQSAPSTQGVLSWDSRSNTLYLPGPLPVGEQKTDSAPVVANAVTAQNSTRPPDLIPPPVAANPLPIGEQRTESAPYTIDVFLWLPPNVTFSLSEIPTALPIDATNKGAGKSKKHNKKIERYIARYKDKLYEFVSLNELEQFVADVKDDEKIKPKRERSAIKITLSPDFKEEIEEEIDIPARLQSMPTTAAMAQIRRIDQIFEKILARMQDDENDDEETLLWLM